MKFAIAAVVVLALAMGVQSSLIGLGGVAGIPGLGTASVSSSGQVLAQGPALGLGLGVGIHGIPAAIDISASPLIAAGHIPAIAAGHIPAIAAAVPGIGATYVAKTRGAVHTAPLSGHIQSAASVNLAPAPGTW